MTRSRFDNRRIGRPSHYGQWRPSRRNVVFASVVAALLIASHMSFGVVMAGSLNSEEARVVEVARGTFEYEGKVYVAKEEYVNQLIDKLSEDDMELTSEEADEMIQNIRDNVEIGVEDGYIVEINTATASGPPPPSGGEPNVEGLDAESVEAENPEDEGVNDDVVGKDSKGETWVAPSLQPLASSVVTDSPCSQQSLFCWEWR